MDYFRRICLPMLGRRCNIVYIDTIRIGQHVGRYPKINRNAHAGERDDAVVQSGGTDREPDDVERRLWLDGGR